MNFFESQDCARRNTSRLIFLFVLAVVTLIIMTNLLFMVALGNISYDLMPGGGIHFQEIDWQLFATISAGAIFVISAGSLYKIITLSGGGKVVAESLGGILVVQNTNDVNQRKLLNVVEEIAIASGTPVPPVYLFVDEPGINAFASGFTPHDAVIGITQGAIDRLSRDQLQGVIAHEFSHIFNGDMRLNIRLMGVIHGIVVIGTAGYYLLRYSGSSRTTSSRGGIGLLVLAFGLVIIGFIGTFFGNLIKAAVSRQREYLADATAVRYTRNPDGIAGALKRIGGLTLGSKLKNPGANEISHLFFSQGASGFMQILSATHPPLDKRIRRIEPGWDGKFDFTANFDLPQTEENYRKKETISRDKSANKVAMTAGSVVIADVAHAINQIGNPEPETFNLANSLITGLPVVIKEAAHEAYGARAVIYCLALDRDKDVCSKQLELLKKYANQDVYNLILRLHPKMEKLDIKYRLPVIDITMPALKQLSLNQYQVFRGNIVELIKLSPKIKLMEWSLQKILFTHLDAQFFKLAQKKISYFHIEHLKKEIELILSVMAYAGHPDENDIEAAFKEAAENLNLNDLKLVAKNKINLLNLENSVKKLGNLRPLEKPQLLMACAASVAYDKKIASAEVELLRVFSDIFGCPMPPINTL
jgi:Zn-dependent protease with chaperone function